MGEMQIIVIEPGRRARNYWRDFWRYRELLFILAWRNISVRYKQTAIGVAWALLRPAMVMMAFLFFRRMAGIQAVGPPEPMLVMAAVLPWQFFSTAVQDASNSLVGGADLISKVYFPRLILPCASVVTSFADFFVSLSMLLFLMAWYGCAPGWRLLWLPGFAALLFLNSLGLGLLLATLSVKFRDVRHVVPFFIQFGVLVSPVGFSTSDVPELWRPLYMLNPLVGAIEGFRWSIIGAPVEIEWGAVAISVAVMAGSLWGGITYFRAMENQFTDVI